MSNVITDYQKWKAQGESLRTQAKLAMETRFRELLSEAIQVAEEYRTDFGGPLKPPASVTAFRYKTGMKPKAKKAAKGKTAVKPQAVEAPPEAPPAKPSPKVLSLQKRLATAKKKFEDAKAAGQPTRNLEDKMYELEDDLRLASQTV